jgi:nicotinate phosphoribosyltransferase
LSAEGLTIHGVRIDSGDLAQHARRVRRILNDGGLSDVSIFASGGLDETELKAMTDAEAPIDAYGIGTRLDVSADAPYLDCAYKLQEYAGKPRRKRSEGKETWPGAKQVFRRFDSGRMVGDVVALAGDVVPGQPLLEQVMRGGQRILPAPTLNAVREVTARNLAQLPNVLRKLDAAAEYPVEIARSVRDRARLADQRSAALVPPPAAEP